MVSDKKKGFWWFGTIVVYTMEMMDWAPLQKMIQVIWQQEIRKTT